MQVTGLMPGFKAKNISYCNCQKYFLFDGTVGVGPDSHWPAACFLVKIFVTENIFILIKIFLGVGGTVGPFLIASH